MASARDSVLGCHAGVKVYGLMWPHRQGQTALHWAACCCHVPIVRLLCSEGAILDVKENDGREPQS